MNRRGSFPVLAVLQCVKCTEIIENHAASSINTKYVKVTAWGQGRF